MRELSVAEQRYQASTNHPVTRRAWWRGEMWPRPSGDISPPWRKPAALCPVNGPCRAWVLVLVLSATAERRKLLPVRPWRAVIRTLGLPRLSKSGPRPLVRRFLFRGRDNDRVRARKHSCHAAGGEPSHCVWRRAVRRTNLGDHPALIRSFHCRALNNQPVAYLGLHRPFLPFAYVYHRPRPAPAG